MASSGHAGRTPAHARMNTLGRGVNIADEEDVEIPSALRDRWEGLGVGRCNMASMEGEHQPLDVSGTTEERPN